MRFTRDYSPSKYPIHCCLFDAQCREDYRWYHMPLDLYLNFLKRKDGRSVRITLWGKRGYNRWMDSIEWETVNGPKD